MNLSPLARWTLRLVDLARRSRSCTCRWSWSAILSFNTATSLSLAAAGAARSTGGGRRGRPTGPREALWNSVKVALAATAIALVLGTLAAFAMQRFRFFGRNSLSFLFVLPIALPGIVTGVALQNTSTARSTSGSFDFRIGFGFHSLVIAHATFCVVLAYNNVVARLRRSSPNLLEASADLGAHGSQTFRYVTFPLDALGAARRRASWPSP